MFALLIPLTLASTVNIEATGHASAGDRVTSPSTGVALTLPAGYSANLQGETLMLQGPGGQGGLVLADPHLTLDGAVAATQGGLMLGDGTFFAQGQPVYGANNVTIALRSSEGSYVGYGYATTGGPSPLSVVVVGPSYQRAETQSAFHSLVGSLGAASTAPSPPTPNTSSGPWHAALAGRQLRNYQTRDSMSSQTRVDLCSDGSLYVYTGGSFHSGPGSVANVSGAGHSRSSGRWSVQGSTLSLHWADGTVDTRTMSHGPNQELMADGERWLRADLEHCR